MSDSNMNAPTQSKQALLDALKKAHQRSIKKGGPAIPYSYKTLLKLEKEGIIPRSVGISYGDKIVRSYSKDEIKDIVNTIIAHQINKSKKNE